MSALDVKHLKPVHSKRPSLRAVGGVSGLLIQVTPNGAKSWLLRTTIAGERRELGLGAYPETGLARARDKAREVKDAIREGRDPIAERKATRAAAKRKRDRITFAQAVDEYLGGKLDEFRNEKHRKQWRATLDTYAAPVLGSMAVADIAVDDVKQALEPIWTSKTETATRLRGRIEAVLSWATVAGHRSGDNPARWKGNLSELLPKPSRVASKDNQPALAIDDAPAWFKALQGMEGTAARALEFLTLTAARSGEIRGATWDEIDLEARIWTIPAERMKAGREHRVPLSGRAVAVLETMERREGVPYVFAALRGGMLSDMTISAVMRRMDEAKPKTWIDPRSKRPAVPHGMRSTFRDWAAERTDYPRDMAEIALAHNVGSAVERAYRRGDMVEKRRALMDAWAAHVVSMRGSTNSGGQNA
ncbi:tyrosine-type recombinase/integrase [Paracoccus sp. KR1-242]|uniref:tyrosine-type recombinase/integrase n=1 Tax=Paracoccus sp. KR1-242 TaxID=3410028 RepID=UPI003C097484